MDSLSDEMLIEAYISAIQLHLSPDFIALLEMELISRHLEEVVKSFSDH